MLNTQNKVYIDYTECDYELHRKTEKKNKRKKERDVHIPCTFILHMLIPTCRSPMGNDWWNSVVIHNRNVLWMLSDSVIVSSISWQKSRLRWQFCSRSHFPVVMASVSSLRACASCPWPMEIDRISARGTSHVSGDEGRFREAEFLVMDFFFTLNILSND